MIVFQYEILEQFLTALAARINNQVFFHFLETKTTPDAQPSTHEVMMQFLGRPDPSLVALYQFKLKMAKKEERDLVISQLQTAFKAAGEITLIQGTIREMVMSIA